MLLQPQAHLSGGPDDALKRQLLDLLVLNINDP
jgi:hypothetical protein